MRLSTKPDRRLHEELLSPVHRPRTIGPWQSLSLRVKVDGESGASPVSHRPDPRITCEDVEGWRRVLANALLSQDLHARPVVMGLWSDF
jgi:hypothetical protein